MNFGQPVTIPKLADAVEAQIANDTALGRDKVFTSLLEDIELIQNPPGDRFVAVRPQKFPVDQPTAAAGGRDLTGFNSIWRFAFFARLNLDQEFRSSLAIRQFQGPLTLLWTMFRGTTDPTDGHQGGQMFTPLDTDGNCVLREPGRLLSFDMEAKRLIDSKDKPWQVIPSFWELKFTADLT